MKDKKNKVLVITYDFFPDRSPNTYRWFNVLKSWKNYDLDIYVVTSLQKNLPEYEEIEGIKVYRVGNNIIEKVKKYIPSDNKAPKVQNSDNTHIVKNVNFVKKIYNLTWKKLYFPDFAFLWQKPAFRISKKLIREKNIYNVITVSWPFSDHVVGSRLKAKFNINWIADTIDPFFLSSAVNNGFLYKKTNYRYERHILDKADSITLLTQKLKDKYSEIFPEISNKITVNHNVFVPYRINKVENSVESNSRVLVFVGTLSPVTRSPKNLLKIFQKLLESNVDINLQLHFYGNLDECDGDFEKYSYLINKNLFLHGFTSRDEIAGILQKADAIVNIGNQNLYQEPSKIVEYIYLKKKILNVCSLKDDTSKEMLTRYPLHLNLYSDDCNDSQKLNEVFEFLENKSINVNDDLISFILDKYILSTVEKKYFELLKFNNE